MHFDMDRLQYINELYGNKAGDFAIRALATAIRAAAPKEGITARMGGDEFLTVLPGAEERIAGSYIKKFEKELAAINKRENRSFEVEASCGMYVVQLDELTTLDQCIRMSDEAMYREKEERHAGRDG